jgi:hypothetical protein
VGLAVPFRAKSYLVNLNCQSGEAICTFAALCRCAAVPLARAGMFVGEIMHVASSSRTLPNQAQHCQQSSLRKLCNHWKTFSALATHQTCTVPQMTSHFLCTHLGSTVTAFRLGAVQPQMAVVGTSKLFLTYAFQPSAILQRRRFDAVLALVRL